MGFSRQEHWSGLPLPSKDGAISVCPNIFSGQLLTVDTLLTSMLASRGDGISGRRWLGPDCCPRLPCALHVRVCTTLLKLYVVAGLLSASECR